MATTAGLTYTVLGSFFTKCWQECRPFMKKIRAKCSKESSMNHLGSTTPTFQKKLNSFWLQCLKKIQKWGVNPLMLSWIRAGCETLIGIWSKINNRVPFLSLTSTRAILNPLMKSRIQLFIKAMGITTIWHRMQVRSMILTPLKHTIDQLFDASHITITPHWTCNLFLMKGTLLWEVQVR